MGRPFLSIVAMTAFTSNLIVKLRVLSSGRELILSTSGSRGFFPLGASLRFAWREFVAVTMWLHW